MSLFHKLQDVYFDAMHLQETLEAIPPECDCWNAEAHLAADCCCVAKPGSIASTMALQQGCLVHLGKLSNSLSSLQADWRYQSWDARREEHEEVDQKLQSQVSQVLSLCRLLEMTIETIEDRIEQSKATCLHADLQRIKESGADLKKLVTEMNGLL
jgi:hypothetical protein